MHHHQTMVDWMAIQIRHFLGNNKVVFCARGWPMQARSPTIDDTVQSTPNPFVGFKFFDDVT